MTEHVRAVHADGHVCDDAIRFCGVCHLYACSVCGCAEGSLLDDCPGEQLTTDQQEFIHQVMAAPYTVEHFRAAWKAHQETT